MPSTVATFCFHQFYSSPPNKLNTSLHLTRRRPDEFKSNFQLNKSGYTCHKIYIHYQHQHRCCHWFSTFWPGKMLRNKLPKVHWPDIQTCSSHAFNRRIQKQISLITSWLHRSLRWVWRYFVHFFRKFQVRQPCGPTGKEICLSSQSAD